ARGEARPEALHPRVATVAIVLLRNEYVTRGITTAADEVLVEIVEEVYLPLVRGRGAAAPDSRRHRVARRETSDEVMRLSGSPKSASSAGEPRRARRPLDAEDVDARTSRPGRVSPSGRARDQDRRVQRRWSPAAEILNIADVASTEPHPGDLQGVVCLAD